MVANNYEVCFLFFVPRVLPWNVFYLRLQPSSFASLLSVFCEFMKKGAGALREDVTREASRNQEITRQVFRKYPICTQQVAGKTVQVCEYLFSPTAYAQFLYYIHELHVT